MLGTKPGVNTQTGEYLKEKEPVVSPTGGSAAACDPATMPVGVVRAKLKSMEKKSTGTLAAVRARLSDAVEAAEVYSFSGDDDGASADDDVEVVEPWGMPYLARVTVSYLKMQRKHIAGEVGRSDATFRESSGYADFCEQHPRHTGPCVALWAGAVRNVPLDTLHGVMQIGELQWEHTILQLARSLQATGYDPLLGVQRAWLRLTKPFMANDVAARQEKLVKGFGGDGTGRVTLRDGTPKSERRQMTHDKRIVTGYIERCCLGDDNHLRRELLSFGHDIVTLRQKAKEWLAKQLEFELLKCLRTGSKTRKDLMFACASGDDALAMEAHLVAERQTASVMTGAEAEEIVKKSMGHMSAEDWKAIVCGGYLPFLEEMNNNVVDGGAIHAAAVGAVTRASRRTAEVVARIESLQGQIGDELVANVDISDEVHGLHEESQEAVAELKHEVAAANESLVRMRQEERRADAQLATLKSRVALDAVSASMKKSWELLRAWYEPLLTNKPGWTGAQHQLAFDQWDEHFTAHYEHSTKAYVVNFRENQQDQMEYCAARYGEDLTTANWSTQRSECCGKKIKDEGALLFGFASRGFNNADIITLLQGDDTTAFSILLALW
jgi:hypothetical protein